MLRLPEMDEKTRLMFLATVAALMITLLAACGGPAAPGPAEIATSTSPPVKQGWQQRWDKTLAEARKEGKVVVYSTNAPEVNLPLKKAFESKYGIEAEFFIARPPELAARLSRERQAGMYLPDFINVGVGSLSTSFKPSGYVDRVEPLLMLPEVVDAKNWLNNTMPFIDEDRKIVAMIAGFRTYIVRNTDLVKEGEIKSFMDLTDARWKGKITMDNPAVMGSGAQFVGGILGYFMSEEEGLKFLKALARQEVVLTNDVRLLVEWVARGKYAVALAPRRETVSTFIRQGAPIAWVYPAEGGEVSPAGGCIGLMTSAPHPNAATIFINWLLSKEGQTEYARGFGSPSRRTDVQAAELGIDPDTIPRQGVKMKVPQEEFWLKLPNAQKVFAEIFGPVR